MKRPANKNRAKRQRKGSALLLTMAVLALLLIVAIFFTFDAQLSSKISNNYKHSTQTRLLHECGLNRALMMIDSFSGLPSADNSFLNPASNDNIFTPIVQSGDWEGWRFMTTMKLINSQIDSQLDFAFSSSFKTQTDTWTLTPLDGMQDIIRDAHPTSPLMRASWKTIDDDTTISGLYAYLIIDETGKLDPGYLSTTAQPTSSLNSLKDINMKYLFNNTSRDTYQIDTCYSYAHLSLNANASTLAADLPIIRASLFPGTIPVKEEFWFDANNDSICLPEEIHSRMDVKEIGSEGAISYQDLFRFLLVSDTDPSKISGSTDSSQSLWLHGLNTSGGVNLSDTIAERRCVAQFIANIWDYTDTDDTPKLFLLVSNTHPEESLRGQILRGSDTGITFPVEPGDISGNDFDAAVLGVESRTVLSEVIWQVYADSYNPLDKTVDMKVGFKCRVGNPMSASASTAKVIIGYSCELDGLETPITGQKMEINFDLTTTDSKVTGSYMESINFEEQHLFGGLPFTLDEDKKFRLSKFTIDTIQVKENNKITQQFPTNLYPNLIEDVFMTWTPTTSSDPMDQKDAKQSYSGQVYAIDPLMAPIAPIADTNNKYWSGDTSSSISPEIFKERSLSSPIINYSSQNYCDVECKNSSFTTLSELGRVHSPHSLNTSIKLWSTDGSVAYDAYLLDMFTTNKDARRTVNINTPSGNVINAILASAGTMDADPLKEDWLEQVSTINPLLYRGDASKFFRGRSLSDVNAEEALCSFIELLNTRQNYYTVIACARAIDDLGNNPNYTSHTRCVDLGGGRYGIVKGTYKTISAVYRDAWGVEPLKVLRTTVLEE